jgi:hypothetical protein
LVYFGFWLAPAAAVWAVLEVEIEDAAERVELDCLSDLLEIGLPPVPGYGEEQVFPEIASS